VLYRLYILPDMKAGIGHSEPDGKLDARGWGGGSEGEDGNAVGSQQPCTLRRNMVGVQGTGCVLDRFLLLFYIQEYRTPAKGIIKKLEIP